MQFSHGRSDRPIHATRSARLFSLSTPKLYTFPVKHISFALRASIYTSFTDNPEIFRCNDTAMSTRRSSAGPVHYPSAPGFPLPQSPSSSFRPNHVPSYSIPPPPIPEFDRRISSRGSYTPSIAPSIAGTSTGSVLGRASGPGRKRRQKEANGKAQITKKTGPILSQTRCLDGCRCAR